MASEKRSYYKRGKTRLDDKMFSALIEAVEEQANKLAKDGKEEQIKQFLKDIVDPTRLSDIADKMAEDIVKKSRKDVRKAVKFESKQKLGFEKRLYKSYQKSIDAYLELLGISLEAIENHRKITHDNLGEKDTFLPFLLRLHTRVYRNANEILALMRSGYGSGAIARQGSLQKLKPKQTISPLIAWTRDTQGQRQFVIERDVAEHEDVVTFKDGVLGVLLTAYFSPAIRDKWPTEMSIRGSRRQFIGAAQVPVLSLMRKGELLKGNFIEAAESIA